MATRQQVALTQKGNREIGNLNSIKIRTLNHGAVVVGEIDNFTLVELGFNTEGERTATQLSDVTKKSYLIATPEKRMLGEELVDFYNAAGERARIVFLDEGVRFDTSAFRLNTGVTSIKNGQVAHFDPATKKFVIQESASPVAAYATASKKFVVVSNESDVVYTSGKALVRLEVQ
ncbi:hypothetical protein ACH6EH_06660 [Paenibacillus sp. JSM ZJ436]|uniref:hypothetical protein n=1 Tax=Paenibacillus sp. JSM ZJ436 TaxID=3376190 RepID=UPI0037A6270C